MLKANELELIGYIYHGFIAVRRNGFGDKNNENIDHSDQ